MRYINDNNNNYYYFYTFSSKEIILLSFLIIKTIGRVFKAVFQVAERVTVRNLVKTVACPTRLKLSKSANFSRIPIKFKPPNQVA